MKLFGRSVLITDNNVEKALKKFKKKIIQSGLLLELRDRESYIKPTTRRKNARSQAKKRWEKYVDSKRLPDKKY